MRIFLTGASAGIGLATARALTAAGHEVWGTARRLDRLPKDLTNFHPIRLDLNDMRLIENVYFAAQSEAGSHFDVLINNAGDGWFGPGEQLPPEALRAQFETLVFGPIRLMQLALPAMRAQPGGGLIINVTSLAARLPLPFSAAYSAAKAALSVFTATLQMEESAPRPPGQHRVRFVDLQPCDINTGFNRAMSFWPGQDRADDPLAAAVRRTLAANDASMAAAPPPGRVAEVIRALVDGRRPAAPMVTVGNLWQGWGGPLAYRFLPRRLMLWTVRKNGGL